MQNSSKIKVATMGVFIYLADAHYERAPPA